MTLLSDDGRETIVAMLERPAFLGEVALLDEAPRSATVMTLEPTEFLQIGRASFKALLTAHPAIAMKIMARLANELRRATEQIRTLSLFDVHGRVLRCLLMMGHEHGESTATRMVIRPRPSVKDLALMIGCSRETVSRAMKLLQDSGYVSVVDRGLAIEHRAIRRYHLPSLQNLTPPKTPSPDRPDRRRLRAAWRRAGRPCSPPTPTAGRNVRQSSGDSIRVLDTRHDQLAIFGAETAERVAIPPGTCSASMAIASGLGPLEGRCSGRTVARGRRTTRLSSSRIRFMSARRR